MLVSLSLIILLNPILVTFILDTDFSLPDTFAYIAQAENMYSNLQIHTGPWGHVDNSLILPPLYPLLITLFIFFDMDGLKSAILISQLAGIAFSIFSLIYIQSITNRIIAVISVVSIQFTFVYFNFASLALTESLFLALLAGILILIKKIIVSFDRIKIVDSIVLGIACSLIFLTRELGIVVLILVFILVSAVSYRKYSKLHAGHMKHLALIMSGFILASTPYYITKAIQTGADPLARNFRLNNYVVEIENKKIINKITGAKELSTDNYLEIYKKRREQISLLPDSSEMLGYAIYKSNANDNHFITRKIKTTFIYPEKYINKFVENVSILKANTGNFIFVLFICLCVTSLLYSTRVRSRSIRVIIPLFIFLYLLLLSVFTSYISRYIAVIVPIVLIHICTELYVISYSICSINKNINKNNITLILAIFLPVIILAGSPRLFYEKHVFPRNTDLENKLRKIGEIVNGEPVFTTFPVLAYSVNGNFRQLPNDKLEKVAQYANKTGVQWLLLVNNSQVQEITKYWTKAYQWITIEKLDNYYPDTVTYCCGVNDINSKTHWKLYKFDSVY